MKSVSRTLLCLFLVILLSWPVPLLNAQSTPECGNIELSTTIIDTSNGQHNGQVTINPKGGVSPYYYVFYYENGQLVTQDVSKNVLKGLHAGIFYCSVVDATGCTKKVKISIK